MNGRDEWPPQDEPPPARQRTVYKAGGEDTMLDAAVQRLPAERPLPGASTAVDPDPWSLGPPAPPPYRRSRHVARFVAPVIFLAVVVGLVTVVMKSGVLGPSDGGQVVSPSASASVSPSAKPIMYKVKKDDTLTSIALKHHTSVAKILQLNPDLSINNLRVGQKIKLPAPQ